MNASVNPNLNQPDVPVAMLNALRQARRLVILTGAGMSAESGIPTFRDAMTGLWEKFDPMQLATPEAWRADRERVWAWYEWRRRMLLQSQPNRGHLAIPKLANALKAATGHDVTIDIVTQNVDDLHERAGSTQVLHVHGSLFAPLCSGCRRPGQFGGPPPVEQVAKLPPPACKHCGGVLRPGVVWFGENLPSEIWQHAESVVSDCDALLVVGTSGVVYPAAGLPLLAKQNRKWVGEINPNVSDLSNQVDLHWQTTAAQGLPELLEALLNCPLE